MIGYYKARFLPQFQRTRDT